MGSGWDPAPVKNGQAGVAKGYFHLNPGGRTSLHAEVIVHWVC